MEDPLQIIPESIDLSKYPDLYFQQNLIVFSREIASKTNDILDYLKNLAPLIPTATLELTEEKLEEVKYKIYRGILNKNRNKRLLSSYFKELKCETQRKVMIRKKLE